MHRIYQKKARDVRMGLEHHIPAHQGAHHALQVDMTNPGMKLLERWWLFSALVLAFCCAALVVLCIFRCLVPRPTTEDQDMEDMAIPLSTEKFEATCPQGHHLLHPHRPTSRWICGGRLSAGGCLSGISAYGNHQGIARLRCETCNFDLCSKCQEAWQKRQHLASALDDHNTQHNHMNWGSHVRSSRTVMRSASREQDSRGEATWADLGRGRSSVASRRGYVSLSQKAEDPSPRWE